MKKIRFLLAIAFTSLALSACSMPTALDECDPEGSDHEEGTECIVKPVSGG